MSLAKRWAARIRSRMRSAGLRAKQVAAATALLVVAGGAWLAFELTGGPPAWSPVDGLAPADVPAATALAAREGIACRVASCRLLAASDQVERLESLLVYEGVLQGPDVLDFERLEGQGSPWQTPGQREQAYRLLKMRALSRLIGNFPSVRRATVFLEPGERRGLGRAAVPPTAAVQVVTAEGSRMSGRLVGAVADLVAGSTAGMSPSDVRIVDQTGSYRVDANGAVADDPVERLREIEAFYQAKIRGVVRYIDDVLVGVSVAAGAPVGSCRSASVSVPRSYLAALHRGAHPGGADPNDTHLAAFAAGRLRRIRHAVARAVGADDPNVVTADWYDDAPSPAVARAGLESPGLAAELSAREVACGALLVGGVLSGWAALRRRRRGRRAEPPSGAPPADPQPAGEPASALAALRDRPAGELGSLLLDEHPQTVALVLAHVEPDVAAEVLAGMEGEKQVDVSRRIAELASVDEQIVEEVARGLTARGSGPSPAGGEAGGAGRVARILHHAGYATEKAVLDGLSGPEPTLAESIRKRMFVFEDVGLLPRRVLQAALEGLGSDELAIALRTAGKEMTGKLLSALSREAADRVRQEMERIGPVRLSDVEAAQERVVAAVRRLESGVYVSANLRDTSEVVA